MNCNTCGEVVSASQKHCDQCGSPVDQQPDPDRQDAVSGPHRDQPSYDGKPQYPDRPVHTDRPSYADQPPVYAEQLPVYADQSPAYADQLIADALRPSPWPTGTPADSGRSGTTAVTGPASAGGLVLPNSPIRLGDG